MKDQYFGDTTDYIKYGILRLLSGAGFDLGIHWAWTADDGSSDGSRTRYLVDRHLWRGYDPQIFDSLERHLSNGVRRLRVVEEEDFISGAVHCFDEWPPCPKERDRILSGFLERMKPASLIFMDPDNGLGVQSVPIGRPASEKYVYDSEINNVWRRGHSLIVYQHFPRVQRKPYTATQLDRLRRELDNANTAAIITSHVVFLCCFQHEHAKLGTEALKGVAEHWTPHVKAYVGLSGGAVGLERLHGEKPSTGQQELPL